MSRNIRSNVTVSKRIKYGIQMGIYLLSPLYISKIILPPEESKSVKL